MKHSKKHSTSDRSIEKKFRNVQNTQEGIQSLTVWAIHHQDQAERIIHIWKKIFVESEAPHTLTLMYVCNDIVQNCKRKNAVVYKEHFKLHLPDALSHMSKDDSVIHPVQRIFKIWTERLVFEENVISELQDCLITEEFRDKVQQEEIDKKLLAEFKPNKVVESLRSFRRLELDADLKYRQISNLRLDLTNSEAIKQLKDRAHGSEYTRQFEEHSKHLEEFKGDLVKVLQERTALIELLELTEHFYELQYGEALVVANAYKNFGLRVTKQETQLEEIMKPYSGSHAIESPACSPPHSSRLSQVIDMEMSDDERGEDDEPPVEPYSPSMMESPDRPIGSPISPNTSLTDLDIVKGVVQPYDPTETLVSFDRRSLLENVYNPKAILDNRSTDISTRLQNLLPSQQVNTSFNTDGDGTPTQDEYMDSDKPHPTEVDPSVRKDGSNEDDWDLAYEFLEENMETSNSGAVSISNLTTIQPTADFTALTKNTLSNQAPKGGLKNSTSLPDGSKIHGRHGPLMSLGLSSNQNGSHSSTNSPAVMAMASPTTHPSSLNLASAITAAVTAGLARSNSEPLGVPEEDPNARAQREFLERLTKRGPFKPSRFLQKLTEEKKKPSESALENSGQYVQQGGSQDAPPPGPPSLSAFRPKIEYRSGDCPSTDSVTSLVPPGQPGQSAAMLERRIPHIQHTGAPTTFPGTSPIKLGDHGLPSFPPTPDFPGEFPPMDQDMRQFNPARPPPPPPPPPPRPYMNNVPNAPGVFPGPRGGKQFPGGHPPRPEFAFRRMGPNNARMDSHPTWSGVPPPGPPPPFFRPRFSGFE